MAYSWAQLAFVEKWRLHAVRGQIVGMYRPADRTYFDLRLRPGEEGAASLSVPADLHLVDAGDIIREKRIGLLERATVVVRVVASSVSVAPQAGTEAAAVRGRRWLEAGSNARGTLLSADGDGGLLDVGFPVVVQFAEGATAPGLQHGQPLEVTIAETPKGFLVV